jgi:hypothetical protein
MTWLFKTKTTIENKKWFQVVEEISIFEQEFEIVFHNGEVYKNIIYEFAVDDFNFKLSPVYSKRFINKLVSQRNTILYLIENEKWVILKIETDAPEAILTKRAKAIRFFEPNYIGVESIVYWTEEE